MTREEIDIMEQAYRSSQWHGDPVPVSDSASLYEDPDFDQRRDRREIERNRVGNWAVMAYMVVVLSALVKVGVLVIKWIVRGAL